MPETTTLIGTGLLADAIADQLAERGEVRRLGEASEFVNVSKPDVVVMATDGWDRRAHPTLRKLCAETKVPWLPVHTELGRAVIGPREWPGEPGCGTCVELRRQRIHDQPRGLAAVLRRHGTTLAQRASSWLTPLAADVVAALTAAELSTMDSPGLVRCVDLQTLAVTAHRFLPDPLCPDCGSLPADSALLANLALESRPKTAPGNYRVRPVVDEFDSIESSYVDGECGLIRPLVVGSDGGLAVATAPIGLRAGGMEGGYGRTSSYRASRTVAVLEALERYGGVEPGGKRTVLRASYAEIRDRAVNPSSLGLYPPERHHIPGFRFTPFDECAQYRWVWGYSFARQSAVLVPESYAYYRVQDPPNPPFVYEISNGCALGGCLEEAIMYGILEVAERDAFLMTWYGRMTVPRIDLASAVDRGIPLLAEAINAETGYQVLAFDTTVEQGIPCVWTMAVRPTGPAEDDPRPMMLCAAGSHLDPERATENALSELGTVLSHFIGTYQDRRGESREMAADPAKVQQMEDHQVLYGNPDVFDRLDFLTRVNATRRLADMPQPTAFRNADLRDDLAELVRRYVDSGLDIIVVDQTTPEHRAGGFACVKVIIPGTLPMTFGHDHRRVDGLPRLHEVPHRLGYRDRPLTAADINPHPHPFP